MSERAPDPPERELRRIDPPLTITSRLLAGLRMEGAGTVHVEPLHRDEDGRVVYRWYVDGPNGEELGCGEDIRSGAGDDVDYRETVGNLLAFLHACAESRRYGGEGAALFDEIVGAWAEQYDDAIEVALLELDYQS